MAVAVTLAMAPAAASAVTFRPTSDGQILETLPRAVLASTPADVVGLRKRAQSAPSDVDAAVALARRLVAIGRASSDPRPYGQAQAALRTWWDLSDPPPPVRLLRATILQYNHDFRAALDDLSAYLTAQPTDDSARLMQATILVVQADYPAAKASCQALAGRGIMLLKLACVASADSFMGDAAGALARLVAVIDYLAAPDPATQAWALVTAGEIAQRLGRDEQALALTRRAHALAPTDVYTLALLADLLLDRHQSAEVVELTRERLDQDALLVRLAEAEQELDRPEAAVHIAVLGQRFAAERARGTTPHLREEAIYVLRLRHEPQAALALAGANWQTQREPIDARLLLEAAAAAGDAAKAAPVLDWLKATATLEPHMQAAPA
jgi:tetratricopeptide (TPR) repeat protein